MTQQPYPQQYPPQGYPQQYPPQGYPQPAQPQYPPAGRPQGPPPGYPPADVASQQQNPFTQPGVAGAPAQDGDPFSNPGAPQGGGDAPGMHQLGGRLLLIRPTSIEKNAPGYQGGRPGDLVRADVIVCDGEPLAGSINGVTEQFTPFAAGPKVPPFYISQMYIRGAVLPGQLEPFIGSRGQVLGRVVKGQAGKEGKPPWLLADPSEADKVLGRQIHARWDEIKSAGQRPGPDQFAGPAQQAAAQNPQPQGYPQPAGYPQPQGYPQPAGYPGAAAQNPYGAPTQYPPY